MHNGIWIGIRKEFLLPYLCMVVSVGAAGYLTKLLEGIPLPALSKQAQPGPSALAAAARPWAGLLDQTL